MRKKGKVAIKKNIIISLIKNTKKKNKNYISSKLHGMKRLVANVIRIVVQEVLVSA
jgi:hypothetical protein